MDNHHANLNIKLLQMFGLEGINEHQKVPLPKHFWQIHIPQKDDQQSPMPTNRNSNKTAQQILALVNYHQLKTYFSIIAKQKSLPLADKYAKQISRSLEQNKTEKMVEENSDHWQQSILRRDPNPTDHARRNK